MKSLIAPTAFDFARSLRFASSNSKFQPSSLNPSPMPILEMKVPSPGESISEVEIAAWLVSDGDYVEKDQAIAEVDSDKAMA